MADESTDQSTKDPTLEHTLWQVRLAADDGGALQPVPAGVIATARFEDGRVFGSGGCNRYSAAYTLDRARLTLGPVASTMMACPDPAGSFEGRLLQALSTVTVWQITDGLLVLRAGEARPVLTFSAVVEASLTGTAWQATGVNNGRGGVASLVAGTEITATFAEGGPVSGSASCNRYTGPFTVDGAHISVGPLATTRMACPAPVMKQERQFLAALGRVTTWRIDGSSLELRDDGGALQVSLHAGE